MAIVAGPDAMTNGDTPAPPMGEAHVCNSPVALSAEPKPKNRTSINIFANFAFDLIPKFACEGAGRIAAKRRIDTLVPRTRSSHKFAERSDANFGFRSGTTRIELLVSLSIPKFVRACRKCLRTSESGH